MEQIDFASRFQEALSKAFAARNPDVRAAYLDLATFYHRKLPGGVCVRAGRRAA